MTPNREQMRATGATVVVTACENCHSQLSDLNAHYGLGMRVEFLTRPAAIYPIFTYTQ